MQMKEMVQKIFDRIKQYDRILIFRHFRPDGDAVGSTKGLQRMLQLTFPEKEIRLQNSDFAEYLAFLGEEDAPLEDAQYADALGIVLDTATEARISNQRFRLCRELIKIDHHIPVESYAGTEWVEEHRSSTCEMIAAFYDCLRDDLRIDREAATYVYAGMVTDTGRFRFRSVSGETMRLAGTMLELGVDTERLYAELYLKEFESFRFEAYVHSKMEITEHGVAYLYIDRAMQDRFSLSHEEASATVSLMDSIKGSLIWIAFIENEDGSIRVRLRSRFLTINELAERYHGGGHDCAAGAVVYSKEELQALVREADALLASYKAANEGWL